MLRSGFYAWTFGVAATSALIGNAATAAETTRPFYQGKTLEIVVGFDAGGGYDAYSRQIARTISKYIPGNPTVIVQNMPGAGSRVAANYLYNIAPQDGTVIGSVVQSTPLDQVFKQPGIHFDASRFNWIGNPIVDNLVSLTSRKSGLKTLDDVKKKGGLICGSSGAGPTLTFPNTIARLLPANVRVVSGYPGVNDITLAMQRGEVNCNAGQAWSSMKATMGPLIRAGQLDVMVQWGTQADPDISKTMGYDVPLITNYARSDSDRSALRLLSSTSALSRPLLAPPNLPADRVAILRKAFDLTMKDPGFIANAAQAGMDIKPMSGADIQKVVDGVVQSSPADIDLAEKLSE